MVERPAELGCCIRRFITSLEDAQCYPAQVLAQLHRQRWEIELGFRDIKQSLQAGEFVSRSKQPDLVRQEVWAFMQARLPSLMCYASHH